MKNKTNTPAAKRKIGKALKDRKKIKIIAILAVTALMIAGIGTMFGIETVSGYNMENTYKDGDTVMVFKLAGITAGSVYIIDYKKLEYNTVRVIATPGDTVEIKEDVVYVNGKELKENYLKERMHFGDMKKITVEEGTVFCMSDNRNNSLDSRNKKIKCIPVESIKGMVFNNTWPTYLFGK